jgi:hypothetical protein
MSEPVYRQQSNGTTSKIMPAHAPLKNMLINELLDRFAHGVFYEDSSVDAEQENAWHKDAKAVRAEITRRVNLPLQHLVK